MANRLAKAKQKTSEISEGARAKARVALDAGKSAAGKTVETSKRVTGDAKRKTSETVDNNPIAIVAGGIAIGAIVAALLPKTEKEKKILGDAGRKINDTARSAANAAKSAGAAHMVDVGLNSDNLREQVKEIFSKGFETAKSATNAAKESLRSKQKD